MTTILPFPPKKNEPEETEMKRRNAIETLEYVLQAMKNGDTDAEGIVIVWNSTNTEAEYSLRYIAGGTVRTDALVGMLEMAKQDMLT